MNDARAAATTNVVVTIVIWKIREPYSSPWSRGVQFILNRYASLYTTCVLKLLIDRRSCSLTWLCIFASFNLFFFCLLKKGRHFIYFIYLSLHSVSKPKLYNFLKLYWFSQHLFYVVNFILWKTYNGVDWCNDWSLKLHLWKSLGVKELIMHFFPLRQV